MTPDTWPEVHYLKTWPAFFDAVACGAKPFEVRKDDRGFAVGQLLILQRYDPETGKYSEDEHGAHVCLARRVSYVLRGGQLGIEEGYVVLGLERPA